MHPRRRYWVPACGWCVAAIVFLLASGPGVAGSPPFWPAVHVSRGWATRVAPGVSYGHYRLQTTAGPLNIHQLRVDLGVPSVRLSTALAHNQLISAGETVSSMVSRWSGAVAGVNADFFDIGDSGMPLNIMVKDGRLLRSPTGWVALAIEKDGDARITQFRWSASVVLPETGQSYWIAGFNSGVAEHGITVLSNDRGYGAYPPAAGTRQTVVELSPANAADGGGSRYRVKEVWPQQIGRAHV